MGNAREHIVDSGAAPSSISPGIGADPPSVAAGHGALGGDQSRNQQWATINRNGIDTHVRVRQKGIIDAGPMSMIGHGVHALNVPRSSITMHPLGFKPADATHHPAFFASEPHGPVQSPRRTLMNPTVSADTALGQAEERTVIGRMTEHDNDVRDQADNASGRLFGSVSYLTGQRLRSRYRYGGGTRADVDRDAAAAEDASMHGNEFNRGRLVFQGNPMDVRVSPENRIIEGPPILHGLDVTNLPGQVRFEREPYDSQTDAHDFTLEGPNVHMHSQPYAPSAMSIQNPLEYHRRMADGPVPMDPLIAQTALRHAFGTHAPPGVSNQMMGSVVSLMNNFTASHAVDQDQADAMITQFRETGDMHLLQRSMQDAQEVQRVASLPTHEQQQVAHSWIDTRLNDMGIGPDVDLDRHTEHIYSKPLKIDADRKSRSTIRVLFNAPITPEALIHYSGAPGGSDVRVVSYDDKELHMMYNNQDIGLSCSRSFLRDQNGDLVCHNGYMFFDADKQTQGIGSRIFARQAKYLGAFGVKKMHTEAARDEIEGMIGYKVWPKMGYNGPVPEEFLTQFGHLLPELPDNPDFHDLYSSPKGQKLWEEHGTTVSLGFDLTPGSSCQRWLAAYLNRKGIRV